MATKSRFFDSVSGDRVYTSDAWADFVKRLTGDGYVPGVGTAFAVVEHSPANLSVNVGLGAMFGAGRYFEIYSAVENVVLAAADLTNPRIDRIVIRFDYTNRTAGVYVKAGTPAVSPVAPALQHDATMDEYGLADVRVNAGVTSVTNANITDLRGDPTMLGQARTLSAPATATQQGAMVAADKSKLDGILAGASRLATAALDGLMTAAHYAMLAAATSVNTANALVKRDASGNIGVNRIDSNNYNGYGPPAAVNNVNAVVARDGNGDVSFRYVNASAFNGNASSATTAAACSGNAASASALSAGADRNKLDGIVAGATYNPMSNQDVSLTSGAGINLGQWNTVGSLALGGGTFLVVAHFTVRDAGSANAGFDARLSGNASGTIGAAEVSCGATGTVAHMTVMSIVGGGQTISAQVYPNVGNSAAGSTVLQNGVVSGERVSYMKAIRLI